MSADRSKPIESLFEEISDPEMLTLLDMCLQTQDQYELMEVENRLLVQCTGPIHDVFENHYLAHPSEGFLCLWLGLAKCGLEKWPEALSCFSRLVAAGNSPWRFYWYICIASIRTGDLNSCRRLLGELCQALPEFELAHQLKNLLKDQRVTLLDRDLSGRSVLAEFQLASLNFAGMGRLLNTLFELGVLVFSGEFQQTCKYLGDNKYCFQMDQWSIKSYLAKVDDATNSKGYSFSSRCSVLGGHQVERAADEPCLRMVRDGRDLMISRWDFWFVKDPMSKFEDCLDLPQGFPVGGLFGMSLLEEWALQEKLFESKEAFPRNYSVCFEKLLPDDEGVAVVRGVLDFLSESFSDSQIREALEASQRDKLTKYGKIAADSGKNEKWRTRDIIQFNQRFDLLCSALNVSSPYEFTPRAVMPGKTWSVDLQQQVAALWVKKIFDKLCAAFPSLAPEDLGYMLPVLEKLAALASEIPLIEFQFCEIMVENDLDTQFALKRVLQLSAQRGRVMALLVAGLMLRVSPGNEQVLKTVRELTSQENMHTTGRYHIREGLEQVGYGSLMEL